MARKISKIAIANRGEVAVRIIRACQELGIKSVLLHSSADVNTLAYRISDEQVCIGEPETAKSYLNIENNINGALSVGADAIHPGFGFLSENANFAQACLDNRIIFIGPSPESIRLFGDKISAKKLVDRVGGPTIPGYSGTDQSDETLIQKMQEIGLPVMVKASGGGGGRGLRVVRSVAEAKETIASARRESMNAFGSDQLFLEKYLDRAKHIEFQIFGDASGKVHSLFERECSVQRRHQKIIEEALSPSLDENLRRRMSKVAIEIAETAKYCGAGTVEFLLQDGEFYFMEMNTRLQVEHPVTELVMGVDLVKAQILTAMEQSLLWNDYDKTPHGHSIECRIYAENPYKAGIPSTGPILDIYLPHGPGRRFEIGIEPGDTISDFYDSMIAKVIVWDENRSRAIKKMRETLKETIIFGVLTNIPLLQGILSNEEFVTGKMTTGFIEKYFPQGLESKIDKVDEIMVLANEIKSKISTSAVSDRKDNSQNPVGLAPWFTGR
jgi:acetyl/propionyl-CoA carboxylase alpha subunit